jgi:hypothetical protein
MKTHILMADSKLKFKININRHGSRLIPNTNPHIDPPFFLLPTTFKFVSNF